jgi:hypothetical protein
MKRALPLFNQSFIALIATYKKMKPFPCLLAILPSLGAFSASAVWMWPRTSV